ncbi:MAG: DNA replication/repair protein RecF [Acidimicrobiia bacterium]|nr:DNA replication/repair protein RecF [Acidimicrobiia bacterium]
MARLERLWLTDFRGYAALDVTFDAGLTAVLGDNGQGKTNLVEAVAWLATLGSFRGAPTEALVRDGAEQAVVRAELDSDGRAVLIEAEIPRRGRTRVQLNRQRLTRGRDLHGVVRVTVFSPDDLALVKEGPGERRRYLDELLAARHPKFDAVRADVDKILRQRNTLLKQAGGRLSDEVAVTLDVWDTKLVEAGTALVDQRIETLDALRPHLVRAYDQLAGAPAEVRIDYRAEWRAAGLAVALAEARAIDVRRAVTTVGPHRDDVELAVGGLAARTHASQGEQRSFALALRLAAHRLITDELGQPPILILDDVFSELDPDRGDALLDQLPEGQTLLTSAHGLPPRAHPDRLWRIADHHLAEVTDEW